MKQTSCIRPVYELHSFAFAIHLLKKTILPSIKIAERGLLESRFMLCGAVGNKSSICFEN
jgi:hypothetical protein